MTNTIAGMHDAILLPTDGSKGSQRSVDRALTLASDHNAVLHVLFVVDERKHGATPALGADELYLEQVEVNAMDLLDDVVRQAGERGIATVKACCRGIPSEEIRRYAEVHDVDLVVMGQHGTTPGHVHRGGTIDEVKTDSGRQVLEV
jgi:nucleotide-binding universal stress UspA family protein